MTNEPNKPVELTEKELEGISGGMTETGTIEAKRTSTKGMPIKPDSEVVGGSSAGFDGAVSKFQQAMGKVLLGPPLG